MICFIFIKLKQEKEEKKKIIENYTSERTMRKKYYNMVEDMKGKQMLLYDILFVCAFFMLTFFCLGKIRVFCRVRPVSRIEASQSETVVVHKVDDFSVTVETPRGQREFQFDKVFGAEASQEDLFHDTNRWVWPGPE